MENELVKKESTEIDIFQDDGFDGFIGMDDPNCLVTPRLNIAQSNSKALIPAEEKYIEGLKAGEWYNDTAGKSYGSKVNFVTLIVYPNVTKWGDGIGNFESAMTPKEFQKILEGGGLYNIDGKWFNTPNPAPNAAHFRYNINFIGFMPDHIEDGLMIFSASGTSFTPAKKFAAKMQAAKGKVFANIWAMETVSTRNDKGQFYKLKPGSVVATIMDKPELIAFIKENVDLAKSWLSQQTHIDYGTNDDTATHSSTTQMESDDTEF